MYRLPENEELLFHYLSGDISDQQKQSIYEWLNQSKENKEYFDKVRADYILMVQASRANLITKNDFSSLKERIKRRRKVRLSLAATTLSLLLLFYFTIPFPRSEDSTDLKEMAAIAQREEPATIRPGSTAAVLQLSTGEQIDIKEAGNLIKDDNGTEIKINEEGEISYSPDKAADGKAGGEVKYNKLIVPRGGEYMLKLSDGTQVWLNSASELTYPVEFNGKDRTVFLKGEAYFDVAKNEEHPFIVCVNEVHLKVLGTSFNVNTHTANSVEAVLVEGSIEVRNKAGKKVLKPNERGVVRGDNSIEVDQVDVMPFIAWKNGDFVFHNESLENIMTKLSLWYNVDIQFRTDGAKGLKLSGEMTRSSQIYDILYFLEKTSNIKFTIKENAIIVNEIDKLNT